MKMLSNHCAVLAGAALSLVAVSSARAAPAGVVLAPGNFIHVVAHLDKTIAFYHGVLGLDQATFGNAAPTAPKFAPNAPVAQLYAVPADTSVGVTVFRLPVMGVGLEFAEFRHVAQKSVRPRPQDPGASTVVLTVQHLDPILQRAHAAHVPILTAGGVPVASDDPAAAAREVLLADPDGYYVELIEHAATTDGGVAGDAGANNTGANTGANGSGNVVQAALMLSIADTERNAHYYRDLLGMALQVDQGFAADPMLSRVVGARRAQVRHSIATIPGSDFKYDFVEWKGMQRHGVHPGVHDHGAGVLRLVVDNVESLVSHLQADGVTVDSTGHGVVSMMPMFKASILSDPNGLFIEPVPHFRPRRPAGQAPRAQSRAQ